MARHVPGLGAGASVRGGGAVSACNCVGPKNGQPFCPCMMRHAQVQDGRYVQDLGPVQQRVGHIEFEPRGCICPPGAEKTCQGLNCPRRAPSFGPAVGSQP